jgi:hypothetical protein
MVFFVLGLLKETISDSLRIRRKPRVLQMPVTGRCNSRCKTCNVWKIEPKDRVDIDADALGKVLRDPYFNKVETVGLNGGEISLLRDLHPIVDALSSLPSLKYVHIISNGLLPKKLLECLRLLKENLNNRGVRLGFTLSVDGIGDIHEKVRGIPGCFQKTKSLLETFNEDKTPYCDFANIGCTISQHNVAYLAEIKEFLSQYDIPVYYHLAVPNKRIHTFEDAEYSVLKEPRAVMLAQEFFYDLYTSTRFRKAPIDKFKYFANFHYLKNGGKGRLARCGYLYQDVTIDEHLDFSLCATASEVVGSLKESCANKLVKSKAIKKIRKQNSQYCETCIHYTDSPSFKGLIIFVFSLAQERLRQAKRYKKALRWLK